MRRTRLVSTAVLLLSLDACGPESQLFERARGKEERSSPQPVLIGFPDDPYESQALTCASPENSGKNCFDARRIRFTLETDGTPLAASPGADAEGVNLFVTEGSIESGVDCLVPITDPAAAAIEAGPVLTVTYDAPIPADDGDLGAGASTSKSGDPVDKLFSATAFFKYSCDARRVHFIVNSEYGSSAESMVRMAFRAPGGTLSAQTAAFIGTGRESGTKDAAFEKIEKTGGAAPACVAAMDGPIPCFDEKTLRFPLALGHDVLVPSASAVEEIVVRIGADGVVTDSACLADAAGTSDLGRLTIALDAQADPAPTAGETAHGLARTFYYSCDAKRLVVEVAGVQKLGEAYAVNVVFANATAGFQASTPLFRASAAKDASLEGAFGPVHAWTP